MGLLNNNCLRNNLGPRFKFVFPDYQTFLKKMETTPFFKPSEDLYEYLYLQFANRHFKWQGEFQCVAHTSRIWIDVYQKWNTISENYNKSQEELNRLSNIGKTYQPNNKLDENQTEKVEEKFLMGSTYNQATPYTSLEQQNKIAYSIEIYDIIRKTFVKLFDPRLTVSCDYPQLA